MSKRASSASTQQTSGSEGDAMDQKKRRRMESNRESARRSRMRKQQHLDDLINQAAQLKEGNARILVQADALKQQHDGLESENVILRAQMAALAERLRSLSSVLRFVEEFSGMAMEIPEMPDPLLKPWQLPSSGQAIMASSHMF